MYSESYTHKYTHIHHESPPLETIIEKSQKKNRITKSMTEKKVKKNRKNLRSILWFLKGKIRLPER